MLDFLFGTVEENAERELANYRAGKGRKKDLGDKIGDALTGRGAAIDRAVEEQYVDNLQTSYGTEIGELNNIPGATPITLDKDTDGRVLRQQIDVAKPKAQAYKDAMQQAALNDVVIDTSKINTPEAIIQKVVAGKKQQKLDEEERVRGIALTETKRQEGRQDSLLANNNLREDRKDARAALLRSQEKGDALELRRDNMNLEYARMARQDRNDMKDRKDKNIMMLMQGLAGIATGFTV
jgi:hypothetical protein